MSMAPELYLAKEDIELGSDVAHVTGYTEAGGADVWVSAIVAHDGSETGFVYLDLDLDGDAAKLVDYYGVVAVREELKRLVREELEEARAKRFARRVLSRLLS